MPPAPATAAAPTGPTARILALADACVLCGLCLPHCPTYALDRTEGESPRGRIMLMKGLAEGAIGPQPAALAHLDHCLSCRHCERVCPAQVHYGALLVASRTALRGVAPPGWRQRVLERVVAQPRLLAAALALVRGVRRGLPGPWRRIPASPPPVRFEPLYRAKGQRRGQVGLFVGCLGPHHDALAARAAIRLLTALGWDVAVPPAQGCCGALSRHAGAAGSAATLAARNRAAFATPEMAAILSLASGCHESLAQAWPGSDGPPVTEVLAFVARDAGLSRLRWRAAHPGASLALHLPCTQRNVTGSAAAVPVLLGRIPGLELILLPADGCCGAAGSHMLTHPARAAVLRQPWLEAIARSGAARLCSANVGCRLHLAAGLEQHGQTTRVQHPLEVLAEHLDEDADE